MTLSTITATEIAPATLTLLFYLFAVVSVVAALAVVLTRKILRAAVYLMGMLVVSAALFVLLNAHFLAGIQVLVYVGGIVVLLTFAIMLTSSVGADEPQPAVHRVMLALTGAGLFCGLALPALALSHFSTPPPVEVDPNNVEQIGMALLDYGPNGYVLPFEVISLLLLAVVIAGIVIARRSEAEPEPATAAKPAEPVMPKLEQEPHR